MVGVSRKKFRDRNEIYMTNKINDFEMKVT